MKENFDLLVIDDDISWREIIIETFDGIYKCDVAATFDEAKEKTQAQNYKIVCMNWEFHTLGTGRRVLTMLKENYPETPVILISGTLQGGLRKIQERYNVEEIILKGSQDALDDIIDDLLDIIPNVMDNYNKNLDSTGEQLPIKQVAPDDTNTISWLHLSDLHLTTKDNNISVAMNQEKVLSALWDDIRNYKQSGINFDFIVFSGDLAYSGGSYEYRRAKTVFLNQLLKKTDLDKSKLFIVPGNHDVNWNKITPGLQDGTLAYFKRGKDDIARLLVDKKLNAERKQIFSKLKYFNNFVNPNANGESKVDHNKLFFSETLSAGKYKISVVGLNSAWMCGLHKNADDKVDEQGKLIIGEVQIDEALRIFEAGDETILKIGILHHPPAWLHTIEKDMMEKRLISEFDLLLHGHYHTPGINALKAIGGSTLLIPAGALYQGRDRHNSYNFVQLDFGKGEGSITFRKYNDNGPEGKPVWQKDLETTGDKYDGTIPLQITSNGNGLQFGIKDA